LLFTKSIKMNLIDTLRNELSGDAVDSLSDKLNITPEQSKSGILLAIPVILAGILKKVSGSGSLGSLGSIFTGNPQSVEAAPESEFGDANSLLSRGSTIIGDLFGGKIDDITKEVVEKTNLSADKSKSLLTMAAPLVMGHVDKLIATKKWSMSDFAGKLFEEKASIENYLPVGLVSSFGLAGLHLPHLNQASSANIPPIEKVSPHATIVPEPSSSSGSVLKWIIIIAILALLAWWFLGRNKMGTENVQYQGDTTTSRMQVDTTTNSSLAERAGQAVAGSLNEAGDWIYNLGANKTIKLPDGVSLNVGENSSEAKLISFIEDSNKSVNDTTWISLDRLFFETGKSTLKPESQDQLSNIAAIMKSYPKVKLKIGGYTDNTGSADANMKISTERANAAMKDLVSLGVSADRLKAEGYGQKHPIADNSTVEGQSQNRRIDVRVTEK
jgi:outer membrane protein OmpA-like peptidoglycan-associated protein